MKLEWLLWDDTNRYHVARHAVAPEEVEELLEGHFRIRHAYSERYGLYGRTTAGRYPVAFFDYLGEDRVYVVTAREMNRSERKRYGRK